MVLGFLLKNKYLEEDIVGLDKKEEEETKDIERISERIRDCLRLEDVHEYAKDYSLLWHRLFTEHNMGKPKKERIISPVGILEDGCSVYSYGDYSLRKKLYVPIKFNRLFIHNSFSLELEFLPEYYIKCAETLTESKTLMREDSRYSRIEIFNKIRDNVYCVKCNWLLIKN